MSILHFANVPGARPGAAAEDGDQAGQPRGGRGRVLARVGGQPAGGRRGHPGLSLARRPRARLPAGEDLGRGQHGEL